MSTLPTRPPRALRLAAPWTLLALLGSFAAQESQEGEERKPHPLTAFHQSEQRRLEKELQGSWMLTTLETIDDPFDELDMSGFAMFHDGYLSMILNGYEEFAGLFSGVETELVVQAHVFRYRIDTRGTLQLAGMMGFSNMNEDVELVFDGSSNVAEYDVTLNVDELQLRNPDGRRFHFRKLSRGEFPKDALRQLQRTRGGTRFDLSEEELRDE